MSKIQVYQISSPTTLYFYDNDLTKNFTHQYSFYLQTPMTFNTSLDSVYATCFRGCGNPKLNMTTIGGGYNIPLGQSVVLSSGTYTIGISGKGVGSGNNLSYSGQATFISPVPEPSDYTLMAVGSLMLIGSVLWRKYF